MLKEGLVQDTRPLNSDIELRCKDKDMNGHQEDPAGSHNSRESGLNIRE